MTPLYNFEHVSVLFEFLEPCRRNDSTLRSTRRSRLLVSSHATRPCAVGYR